MLQLSMLSIYHAKESIEDMVKQINKKTYKKMLKRFILIIFIAALIYYLSKLRINRTQGIGENNSKVNLINTNTITMEKELSAIDNETQDSSSIITQANNNTNNINNNVANESNNTENENASRIDPTNLSTIIEEDEFSEIDDEVRNSSNGVPQLNNNIQEVNNNAIQEVDNNMKDDSALGLKRNNTAEDAYVKTCNREDVHRKTGGKIKNPPTGITKVNNNVDKNTQVVNKNVGKNIPKNNNIYKNTQYPRDDALVIYTDYGMSDYEKIRGLYISDSVSESNNHLLLQHFKELHDYELKYDESRSFNYIMELLNSAKRELQILRLGCHKEYFVFHRENPGFTPYVRTHDSKSFDEATKYYDINKSESYRCKETNLNERVLGVYKRLDTIRDNKSYVYPFMTTDLKEEALKLYYEFMDLINIYIGHSCGGAAFISPQKSEHKLKLQQMRHIILEFKTDISKEVDEIEKLYAKKINTEHEVFKLAGENLVSSNENLNNLVDKINKLSRVDLDFCNISKWKFFYLLEDLRNIIVKFDEILSLEGLGIGFETSGKLKRISTQKYKHLDIHDLNTLLLDLDLLYNDLDSKIKFTKNKIIKLRQDLRGISKDLNSIKNDCLFYIEIVFLIKNTFRPYKEDNYYKGHEFRNTYKLNEENAKINQANLANSYTNILMYYLFAVRFVVDGSFVELVKDFAMGKIHENFANIQDKVADVDNITAQNSINQAINELEPITTNGHVKFLKEAVNNDMNFDGLFEEFVEIFESIYCDFDFWGKYVANDGFLLIAQKINKLLQIEYGDRFYAPPYLRGIHRPVYKMIDTIRSSGGGRWGYFCIRNPYFYDCEENGLFRVLNLLYLYNKTKPKHFINLSDSYRFIFDVRSLDKMKIIDGDQFKKLDQKYNINLERSKKIKDVDWRQNIIALDGFVFKRPLRIPWVNDNQHTFTKNIDKWDMNLCSFHINLGDSFIDSYLLGDVLSVLPEKATVRINISSEYKTGIFLSLSGLRKYNISTSICNYHKSANTGRWLSDYLRNIGRINFIYDDIIDIAGSTKSLREELTRKRGREQVELSRNVKYKINDIRYYNKLLRNIKADSDIKAACWSKFNECFRPTNLLCESRYLIDTIAKFPNPLLIK